MHASKIFVCIIDSKGKVKVHQNLKTDPEVFFDLIFPYLDDIAAGLECVFYWHWPADLCAEHHIRFVLGHASYMKAIHGGKTKNDRIDFYKLATLLKSGTFPIAFAYPAEWLATRDLLRRGMYLSHRCSELVVHIVNTNTRYNLPALRKNFPENTTMPAWPNDLRTHRCVKALRWTLIDNFGAAKRQLIA